MIELRNIRKGFDEREVLKGIDAQFLEGKVNFMIGQSGSGKSVLTKCAVGLMRPDQGEVLYHGRDFTRMERDEMREVRKEIGMLFQESALFDSMTVEENIMFPLTMFSDMSKKEMLERVNFCLDRVNLTDRNNLFPSELSGGMKKRVGIARAISNNPRYLFCDEPNSGLDPKTAIVIDQLIQEITYENNITTVVISHDMNSVIEIGDYIHFLYEGELAWRGTKEEILSTQNDKLNAFVYPSAFMREVKTQLKKARNG